MIRERLALEGPKKQGLKLVHDTSLLENDIESLSSYGLEDGSSLLLLLENPGPIRLEAHVWDRTPEDSLLTAAESGELQHPVSKIEVTVGTFQAPVRPASASSIPECKSVGVDRVVKVWIF